MEHLSQSVDFDTETDKISHPIRDRIRWNLKIRLSVGVRNKQIAVLTKNAMEKFVYSFNEGSKDMRDVF